VNSESMLIVFFNVCFKIHRFRYIKVFRTFLLVLLGSLSYFINNSGELFEAKVGEV
jgi:hypothetical protein